MKTITHPPSYNKSKTTTRPIIYIHITRPIALYGLIYSSGDAIFSVRRQFFTRTIETYALRDECVLLLSHLSKNVSDPRSTMATRGQGGCVPFIPEDDTCRRTPTLTTPIFIV